MEFKPHFFPSAQVALLRFAPSKFAFKIFAPVKSASKRFAFVKLASIKEAALKFALVKLELVKFVFSKLPPSKFVSYKLDLINEDIARDFVDYLKLKKIYVKGPWKGRYNKYVTITLGPYSMMERFLKEVEGFNIKDRLN